MILVKFASTNIKVPNQLNYNCNFKPISRIFQICIESKYISSKFILNLPKITNNLMTDKYIFHLIIKIMFKDTYSYSTFSTKNFFLLFWCIYLTLALAFTMITTEKKASISLHYYLLIISE